MTKRLAYVSSFEDRHGKRRWRFRRLGYRTHYFTSPVGTKAFDREYAGCMQADPAAIVGERIRPGSVSDVIARYYADNEFLDLAEATKTVYRGVLEQFRAAFGDDSILLFDAERISRLMTSKRETPHAAARLRKLLKALFRIARRAKVVPHNFDPVQDTRAPKATTVGYHRWTEAELAAFEATHALGTKPRLAFALLVYGAQRSGDVRFMTAETVAGNRIRLTQSKTANAIDVPVVQPLADALAAGPLGAATLIETKDGAPFTPKGFYGMMKRACIAAGLPHCSPHGLRKSAARRCLEAGCTDAEGMSITGHKTVREYQRYAGTGARADAADVAMGKVMANQAARLANTKPQPIEDAQ